MNIAVIMFLPAENLMEPFSFIQQSCNCVFLWFLFEINVTMSMLNQIKLCAPTAISSGLLTGKFNFQEFGEKNQFYLSFIQVLFKFYLRCVPNSFVFAQLHNCPTGKIQHLIEILFTLFCLRNIGTSDQNHILLYFNIQNGQFAFSYCLCDFSFLLFLFESWPTPSYSSPQHLAEAGIK